MDAPTVENPILASAQATLPEAAEARPPIDMPKHEPASAPTPSMPAAPPPLSKPPQPIDRAIYIQAFKMLKQGKLRDDICAELQKTGVDAATAANIVEGVDSLMSVVHAAYRKAGLKIAGTGALLVVGGILVTAITYGMAQGGGTYVIAWGAVLFGCIALIRGLVMSLRQASENDITRLISAR